MRKLEKKNLDKIDTYSELDLDKHLEQMMSDYAVELEYDVRNIKKRLKKFANAFDKEFPLTKNLHERGISISNVWLLVDVPLKLYALNFTSSAIIELHATLESYVKGDVISQLQKPRTEKITSDLISKKTLLEQVSILHDLAIFDNNDLIFVKKLQRLRNGIAHKNERLISKATNRQNLTVPDIDSAVSNVNFIDLLIKSLRLVSKLVQLDNPSKK